MLPHFWTVLFGVIVSLFVHQSSAALKEFDSCKHAGKPGTCRGYSVCKAQLQNQRITICSYNAREAVVCCPDGEGNRFNGDVDHQVPPPSSGPGSPNSLEEDRNARTAVKSRVLRITVMVVPVS